MIPLESGVGPFIKYKGKEVMYFAGNDYLGMAGHPESGEAAIMAIGKYGAGFGASRQTTGTSDLHIELEERLALFKNREDSVVFASGYLGNKIILEALRDRYSVIFADRMVHPSITDGIPKDLPEVQFYEHLNPDHLSSLIKKTSGRRPLIITDGIFALTGEIAPLDRLYEIAEEHEALLIVDDAHATGVLGKNGRGTPEHFDLGEARGIYQTETMSKAIGSYGGFIAAERELINKIRRGCAFYGASTALPPPVVAASIASLEIISTHPELRQRLFENATRLRTGVRDLGFETSDTVAPVIPLYFGKLGTASNLSGFLQKSNIIAPAVSYPVKTDKFIVRLTVSARHTAEHTEILLETLKKWRETHATN
jgi:7-keto-8-aminopelargonate synthetase-like enzyme